LSWSWLGLASKGQVGSSPRAPLTKDGAFLYLSLFGLSCAELFRGSVHWEQSSRRERLCSRIGIVLSRFFVCFCFGCRCWSCLSVWSSPVWDNVSGFGAGSEELMMLCSQAAFFVFLFVCRSSFFRAELALQETLLRSVTGYGRGVCRASLFPLFRLVGSLEKSADSSSPTSLLLGKAVGRDMIASHRSWVRSSGSGAVSVILYYLEDGGYGRGRSVWHQDNPARGYLLEKCILPCTSLFTADLAPVKVQHSIIPTPPGTP
jgi:hypothetical protein